MTRDLANFPALHAVFQPIVDLRRAGTVYGHESLIRGPADSLLHTPAALFARAREDGHLLGLERAAAHVGATRYAQTRPRGKLFLNFSATALLAAGRPGDACALANLLGQTGLSAADIIIELTEDDPYPDLDALNDVLDGWRAQGALLALDDFGTAYSSLRRWTELRPDIVKVDRFFTRGASQDRRKRHTLAALCSLAQGDATRMVAEGVEHAEDLAAVRDLGFDYAQGFFLDAPAEQPAMQLRDEVLEVLTPRRTRSYRVSWPMPRFSAGEKTPPPCPSGLPHLP